MRSAHSLPGIAVFFLACVLLGSCASTGSSRPAGVSMRVEAEPLRICQAAVDVLTGYSYTLSGAQYPVALDFAYTGTDTNSLSRSEEALLGVRITPVAGGCEVTLQATKGSFPADQLKDILARIKAEALSR